MVRPTITSKLPIDRHFLRTKPLSHLPKPKPKPRSSLDHRPNTARASSSAPDPTSPANSAPSLLEESAFFDVYPEFDPDTASNMHYGDMSISGSTPRLLRPMRENTASSTLALLERTIYSHVRAQSQVPIDPSKLLQALNSSRSHHDQVVVRRVYLHCKGCEGKVRKHISKMEGLTSFSIITPLRVLNSVSKVKNAHFWLLHL